ncbi:hypothetical protein DM02DRAFT_466179, partial [Periconia macrospinosa]
LTMTWQEIDTGVYRTKFGGSEQIYHRVGALFAGFKKEHYRVHCVCSLEFGPDFKRDAAASVKEAWKLLRTELPTLGVVADGPSHRIYKVLDAQGEQDWLRKTFFVEPPGKTSNEIIAREPGELPTVHWLPSTSEVVFSCSHWRIDALGTNWIVDRLLALIANPDQVQPVPQTVDSISLALEDAYGSTHSCSPEQEAFARAHVARFRENSFPNDRLPYKGDASSPPGNSVRATMVFNPATTAALIAACKAHDITITTATMSALGQAVFGLADIDKREPRREKHDFTFATSVNVRPKLQPPYHTRAHATQTYVAGTGCRVRRGASFLESAQALHKHFQETYADDRILQSLRAVYRFNSDATPVNQKEREGVNATTTTATQPPSTPALPPSNITISSLGIIDKYVAGEYGQGTEGTPLVRVRDYHFGIEMMTRQMVTYVGTFRGRLQVSISYNEGYYDEDVPKDILRRIKEALAEGL